MLATTTRPTIQDCISLCGEKLQALIDSGQKTESELAELGKTLDMSFEEFVKFQELKSVAVGQQLTLEDAQFIFQSLGNSPDTFNSSNLETKIVFTQVFQKLLESQISSM